MMCTVYRTSEGYTVQRANMNTFIGHNNREDGQNTTQKEIKCNNHKTSY